MSSRCLILCKIKEFLFFFSQPGAGLTNQVDIQHSDASAPLYLGAIYIFKGFGKVAVEETGTNNASGIVWVISKFFFNKKIICN